jgi:hypothetical protein
VKRMADATKNDYLANLILNISLVKTFRAIGKDSKCLGNFLL